MENTEVLNQTFLTDTNQRLSPTPTVSEKKATAFFFFPEIDWPFIIPVGAFSTWASLLKENFIETRLFLFSHTDNSAMHSPTLFLTTLPKFN